MRLGRWIKFGLKAGIAGALYYTGVLHAWKAIVLREKAVVLMYHRVLTEEERRQTGSHPAVVIDRDTFARQMAFLKRHFVVLSLAEFADRIARKAPFPNGSVVITFDDGWNDNFTNALPILRRHGLPALIFLPANYIGHRRLFWQEALTHLLNRVVAEARRDSGQRARYRSLLAASGLAHLVDLTDPDPRAAIIATVGEQKRLTRAAVSELVESLTAALGIRLEEFAETDGFIRWDQVADMSRQGISFGGHGVDHLLLTQVSADDAEREIRGSMEMIDQRLNETVPTFSFPNGYWTPDLVERVKAAGYRLSFITRSGFVSCQDDPYTVRRLNVHESATRTVPMFLARVVGLW